MKVLLGFAFAVSAFAVFAQQNVDLTQPGAGVQPAKSEKSGRKQFSPEQLAERDRRVLEKTGGFIEVAASGPAVEILDTRTKPGTGPVWVKEVWNKHAKSPFNLQTNTIPEGKCPYAFGKEKVDADNALIVVVLAQAGDKLPALSVFPEERVSVVNCDILLKDKNPIDAEVRVIKECWRSIGFLTGVGYVQQDNDVMQPVFSMADLDADEFQIIQPMNYSRMAKMMAKFNVQRSRRIAYRAAVKQGWAPSPTNDLQKTIWEEVKVAQSTNKVEAVPVKK